VSFVVTETLEDLTFYFLYYHNTRHNQYDIITKAKKHWVIEWPWHRVSV